MFFMMRNTLAALSVAGAAFFCAGTINIVMWAGHGGYYVIGYSFRRKAFLLMISIIIFFYQKWINVKHPNV